MFTSALKSFIQSACSAETCMALCQPLNATEIEVCSISLMDLEPRTSQQPQHNGAGNQELHLASVPETRRRQSRASDRGGVSGGDYQMSHGADGAPPKCSLNGSAVFVVVALPREYN